MRERLRKWAVVLPVLLAVVPVPAGTDTGFSYDDLDAVLDRHVSDDGLVDYDSLSVDREPLDRFVDALGRVSADNHPERFDSDEARLAYWMNAYNALMLRRVVDAWPIASVKKIKPAYGVFWMEKHTLGGERWTLRGLENKVIRDRFDEPRIHFGINCASAGCPALPHRAWRAETLGEELDRAARRFVGDPRNVRIDAGRGEIYLSSIFKWFEEDFTGWLDRREPGRRHDVVEYVLPYLPGERTAAVDPASLKIVWIDYDWAINARVTE